VVFTSPSQTDRLSSKYLLVYYLEPATDDNRWNVHLNFTFVSDTAMFRDPRLG
jgi:hypothetical protein